MTYVIARTASKRPTLQHKLASDSVWPDSTECGLDITKWSRAYQAEPITEILCRKCARVNDRPNLGQRE